ncbi:MAG: FixH family protein [Chloroflexota bacterium]
MTFEVEPNPPVVGPSRLTITLTDGEGAPVKGAELEIEGMMNHDEMQPRRARARVEADGVYEAPFVWTMDGDWLLTVTATLANGQQVERDFTLKVDQQAATDEHNHPPAGLPNNGAVIRIVSPKAGATLEKGSKVKVEIETENFKLGEDGNHWHVYVDGQSPQMVMGQMTETTLADLPPGQHEVSAYLSVGSHQDLVEGASVTITVLGPAEEEVELGMGEHEHEHSHD